MSSPDQALAWGLARYRAGAAGKTLLAGWRDRACLFALGAGLGGETDRDRFATLARYLLRRDRADGYWLVFPAELDAGPHLAAEVAVGGRCSVAVARMLEPEPGQPAPLGPVRSLGDQPQLGDLLDGGSTLPALMRRELDRLAEGLAQPGP